MAYWKRSVHVDLSTGEVETTSVSEEFIRSYLGGSGFTTRVLYDSVGPETDPLDPENVLVIAPGLFVGPSIPTGSKTTFGFKSPLTGGYGKSLVGAALGDELRRAGFDYLVITGAAEEPSVLAFEDEEFSIEPAADLWGLETRETDALLKERYGRSVHTAVIGPAGEQRSKIPTSSARTARLAGVAVVP